MDNRIGQISISATEARQTPRDEFGTTLARTMATGASGALSLAGAIGGGANPALSASVSQGAQMIAKLAQSELGASHATGGGKPTVPGGIGTSGAPASGGENPASMTGGDNSWAMLQAQKSMNEESREFNMQYLQLQEQMQRESREYQTISNIMKVRHDSAKAAINNIH